VPIYAGATLLWLENAQAEFSFQVALQKMAEHGWIQAGHLGEQEVF
jgi:hypothetical protein